VRQDESASPEQLAALSKCLDLGLTEPLRATCDVCTVQELYNYAIARLEESQAA